MKTIPTGLLSHYQEGTTSIATCWKVTLVQKSPSVTLGFTDYDQDLVIDGVTYEAGTGFLPTAYETQTKGAVDNLEAQGFLDSLQITEQDILSGLWDYAMVEIFQVNWRNLSLGADTLIKGRLGAVSTERGKFTAELRGMANAFAQSRHYIYSPQCQVEFGSAKCGIDASLHTVTGTLTSVSEDGLILGDTGRSEAGPVAKTISGITKATTPTVSCDDHGFVAGQYVFFYGINGMSEMNGRYGVILTAATDSFTVAIDTTTFSDYVSEGAVSAQGSAGYFAAGKITMTSGASSGASMEIKESAPGLLVLQLEFPLGVTVGDTYQIVRGCTKRFKEDCIDKYNNGINFRGHPHIPGLNKVLKVGGT